MSKLSATVHLDDENTETNANLIVAAPDLLQVLKCALADLEGIVTIIEPERVQDCWWKTIDEAREAIAKAKGEEIG